MYVKKDIAEFLMAISESERDRFQSLAGILHEQDRIAKELLEISPTKLNLEQIGRRVMYLNYLYFSTLPVDPLQGIEM